MQGAKIVSREKIEHLVRQIVERFHPQRIILFGSQATGKATDESDVDLLVVMDTGGEPPHEVAHRIRMSLEPPKREWMGQPFPVWLDIHVFTPDAFEAALRRKSIFLTTAVTEGIVLYEAPDATPVSALLTQRTGWEGEGMKPETQEWIAKAESDWSAAQRSIQPPPLYDVACFHAQQCAEKYLKAFLEERGIAFPKTHDLVELLNLAGGQLSELDPLKADLAQLSLFAVLPRYIGFRATQKDAQNALQIAEQVRWVVRLKLLLKPETQEWVTKAEGDWQDALILRQSPTPNWDNICFHAQQCAEKYLKAFLEERGIAFPKTHDLVELLNLAGGQLSELDPLKADLAQLSLFAVLPRYIGFRATQKDAQNALQIAEQVRQVVREKLGLS